MSEPPAGSPNGGPEIDGRRRDDLEEDLREMVPYYVEEWEPDEGDVGATLLSLFAELAEEVTERLDRVPEKHRIAFYETLGFDREPPRPARLPLSVDVADRAGENVTVPAGAVATAEPPDGSERLFEVPEGGTFDATPANLRAIHTVDPDEDAIYAHHATVGGGDAPASLFVPDDGENLQAHALYLGDAERLSVGVGSTLTVEIDTDADPSWLHETLRWEYYGERTVDGESVETWHPFPSQGVLSPALAGTAAERLDLSVAGLPGRIDRAEPPPWLNRLSAIRTPAERNDAGDAELTFVPHGTLTETTVDGTETRWIRCVIPDDVGDRTRAELFDLQFGTAGAATPPLQVGASADGLEPDELLHNDVPLPAGGGDDGTIRPFGERPRRGDAFYLGSTDALTKSGAEVTVEFEFEQRGTASGSPVLSWEYFDGEGWSRIPGLLDGTDAFTGGGGRRTGRGFEFGEWFEVSSTRYRWSDEVRSRGRVEDDTVRFDVPADLSETTVAGHEGHWIRVRLVGGNYGQVQFEPVDADGDSEPDRYEQRDDDIRPPAFSTVRIAYNQTEPPGFAVADNNLSLRSDVAVAAGSYRPFEGLPVDEQALYLGFDGPLTDGPINLLFDLADAAYPREFHPQVRWEYDGSGTGEWTQPDVFDGTEGLTERGIVGLAFPDATAATGAFGRELHWIRARVTGTRFGAGDEGESGGATPERDGRACGRYVETVPPAGEPRRYPPSLRGLYPNSAWAENRRTIDGELLGSSDGSVDQTFAVADPPVIEPAVWVDELAVTSEGGRERLRERWPDRTDVETDAAGDPVAFWVRWERQPDLLDSGPDDRHYTVDPIAGSVSFGDGTRGKVPPRGTDNVRASYATGGGAAGNVPAGAVSGFRQSIAFVESVTNPIAGAAGADAEPTAAVTDRAARQLRDRNRAVAPADFERIAMDASRRLARARCRPGMTPSGEYRPGWVTLLVVPRSAADEPTPSATLREDVERAVAARAPATLVGLDRLVVRGPSYVSVSVDVELAASGGSIARLEQRAREAVGAYLHPLTGGPDGDGWRFGELPCRSDLFELLEGVDRVDHVEDLSLRFETCRSTVTVAEGDGTPETSPDALVSDGTHDVTATLADGGGR